MDNPGLRGISTGFDGIDFVTGGLQPEQYVVLLGTPKSFKSATLLAMAKAVHKQAKIAAFIGFEMSNTEQQDRLVSLYSGVSLTRIMNGTLTEKEFKAVQKALRQVEEMVPFVFSTDITSATTVSGIQAKIQEYQPDVVFVDGAYLMQSEEKDVAQGTPQAMTSISRGLKRLAQATKIPVVVTTQASLPRSRSGLTLSSAMYTQAWGQDCDIMLGVERVREEKAEGELVDEINSGPAIVKFKVVESRSGPRKDTLLEWDWSKGSVHEIDVTAARQQMTACWTAHAARTRRRRVLMNLYTILESAGIAPLRETPREIYAPCPMHAVRTGSIDSHPSWSINQFSYRHHCFSCGYGGTTLQGLLVDVTGSSPADLDKELAKQSFLRQQMRGS